MWLGQLTFAIEPGTSLENVVIKVRPPDMRIRGRVLLTDRTPLANARIMLTIRDRRRSHEGFFLFPRSTSSSGGHTGFSTQTDAQGYFVTYHLDGAAEYSVSVKYDGVSAKSRWVRIEEGRTVR